jgi:NADPH:quinone reductase
MEHRLPLTPGVDYAGTVESVGPGVEGFTRGDEVFGVVGKSYAGEGSFAEYVTVASNVAACRPVSLAPEQAAALPLAATTGLAAVDALGAAPGDTIAVVGAAGGVGSYATQLAATNGLNVIAVTSGEQADYVRGLGAAEVVDYDADDVIEELRARAPDGLTGIIDVFHDAEALAPYASLVRPGGRVVSSVAMGIDQALADQPVRGQLIVAAPDRVGELGDLAANGTITVPVEVMPLDRGAEALDRQAGRHVHGKLVLVVA